MGRRLTKSGYISLSSVVASGPPKCWSNRVGWKPRNRSVGGVKCGVVVCVELWVDGANRHILWDRTIGDQLLLNRGRGSLFRWGAGRALE